jgi:hypothetical protein
MRNSAKKIRLVGEEVAIKSKRSISLAGSITLSMAPQKKRRAKAMPKY